MVSTVSEIDKYSGTHLKVSVRFGCMCLGKKPPPSSVISLGGSGVFTFVSWCGQRECRDIQSRGGQRGASGVRASIVNLPWLFVGAGVKEGGQ